MSTRQRPQLWRTALHIKERRVHWEHLLKIMRGVWRQLSLRDILRVAHRKHGNLAGLTIKRAMTMTELSPRYTSLPGTMAQPLDE